MKRFDDWTRNERMTQLEIAVGVFILGMTIAVLSDLVCKARDAAQRDQQTLIEDRRATPAQKVQERFP